MYVRIRDLDPDDRDTVQAIFDGLSQVSRQRRFHGPVKRLSTRMLAHLARSDGRDHVVLVADLGRARRRPVGLARLVRTAPHTAELAVEVVDAMQGRGIGRQLVLAARSRAMSLGLNTIEADVLVDNTPMLRLVRAAFSEVAAIRAGHTWQLRCRLPTGSLEIADVIPSWFGTGDQERDRDLAASAASVRDATPSFWSTADT